MIKRLCKDAGVGICITVAMCFLYFIYAPLELYFTNIDEFWFDWTLLLTAMGITFLIAVVICVGIMVLLCKKAHKLYDIATVACGIVYIATYIQGNFLVRNLPPLDGTAINWADYPAERIKSILVWIVITVLVLVGVRIIRTDKFKVIIKGGSLCMTAMLLVTLISLCFMQQGYRTKANLTVTNKDLFEISENQNFIILLLDAVDSTTFAELMEIHPEYGEIFENFTYYRNAMGVYPFTKHSVPFILSGNWYENDETFEKYSTKAYLESPLFETLESQQYKMGIYESELLLQDEEFCKFDNVLPNEWGTSSWWDFIRWQIQMTGFKYAPYDLKRICFVNPDEFKKLRIAPEGYATFTDSNKEFYEGVLHEEVNYTSQNCFKFIHISGAHLPFLYDENMNIIEDATYETNMEASMTITRDYLNKLRESGAYDNSVIIVMADHGFDSIDYEALYRQNPVLFVKGVGEKHAMQTSMAPVSYVDLQEAYQRLINGADSTQIFDCKEGEVRERRFLFYNYNEESTMYEYKLTGMAWDRETFVPTGKEYVYGE